MSERVRAQGSQAYGTVRLGKAEEKNTQPARENADTQSSRWPTGPASRWSAWKGRQITKEGRSKS